MTDKNMEMQSLQARLQSFHIAHQLGKRRASTQAGKKKGANTVEWPHKQPSADDLARAGFFFRPALESPDNVQCFYCSVKLDGWEPSDDPLQEHIAHSDGCDWAKSALAGSIAQASRGNDAQDPMSEELVAARRRTFEIGAPWPHENKRGWKCKITKMVEAGWCFDPAPTSEEEEADGVTCFYCALSLDGWEPKDDPYSEHKKRNPDCAFFALVEKCGSGVDAGPKQKGKGRGKAATRSSAVSKATRLSTQSVQSVLSEAPSFHDLDLAEERSIDDSLVSNASQATITGTTKGKKKAAAKPKAVSKGAKGRKRAGTVDSTADTGPMYPDVASHIEPEPTNLESLQIQPAPVADKKPAKGTRASKQPVDSSVIEISSLEVAPPKKPARGRKAKTKTEHELETDASPDADLDNSDVSAQLQDELERSMTMDAHIEDELPQLKPVPEKRGVKRTSTGLMKSQDSEAGGAVIEDFPQPPKSSPVAKTKRPRKPSKQPAQHTESDVQLLDSELEAVHSTKPTKAPARKDTKGRKASSTRSSRSSKATIVAEPTAPSEEAEDFDRDELEIEAELQRIAEEQAMLTEQDKVAEFELSPSRAEREAIEIKRLEDEMTSESVAKRMAVPQHHQKNATPSPTGSDKENQHSSFLQPSAKHLTSAPILSPTKTTRIPLAPGTPNRLSPSKSRTLLHSPSKQFSKLTSLQPWEAVDLDSVLLASPQPTPGALVQRLASAVGTLTSPEKALTVEEWVRYQAEKGEEDLRRRCEEMVGAFEREGMRGLRSLEGIPVVA